MENKNNKIAIKDFVKTYNSLTNEKLKDGQIDKIIVRHYAPITEKKAALDLIFKKCIQEKDGVEYIDSFLMQVGLMSVVLSLYTNFTGVSTGFCRFLKKAGGILQGWIEKYKKL